MNIREHIEAGHYPKDEHGMELVATSTGATVRVADVHPDGRIAGWGHSGGGPAYTWNERGQSFEKHIGDLLPPPPRKMRVLGWAVVDKNGDLVRAQDHMPASMHESESIVQATIEYEITP